MVQVGLVTVSKLTVLSLGLMMLMSLSSSLIISGLGEPIAYLDVLSIDAVSVFVGFVSFMPMGLGTRDATSVFLLRQAGASRDVVYSIIVVQRLIWSLVPFAIGLLSASILWVRTLVRERTLDQELRR
jgi:uncharacterized protein (TIRG00374 family)